MSDGHSGLKSDDVKPWHNKVVTGEMLKAAIHLLAGRATAVDTTKKIMEDFEKLMDSGDPGQAAELLKPEKRARGRPRIRPPEEERKHRDLGSYNLFVMKAQNVAGPDVKNHRAFMGLIGTFWKAMDQATRESFISTYKGLLDQLNEKKKAGIKFDFGHELKMYERDHELDTISYFRGFMQQVKALPLPETKQEREARLSTALGVPGNSGIPCLPTAAVPAPIEEDEDMHHGQDDMPDFDLGEEEATLPRKKSKT